MVGPYIKDVPNLLMSWLQQELEQVGVLTLTGHKWCRLRPTDINSKSLETQQTFIFTHDVHSSKVIGDPNQNLLEQKACAADRDTSSKTADF